MATTNQKTKAATPFLLAATAVATLAAGTYFFTGNRGKKNRAMLRGWAVKAKGEVLERIEDLKSIDKQSYMRIVDSVIGQYATLKNMNKRNLDELAKELRGYWKDIEADLRKVGRAATGSTSRSATSRASSARRAGESARKGSSSKKAGATSGTGGSTRSKKSGSSKSSAASARKGGSSTKSRSNSKKKR